MKLTSPHPRRPPVRRAVLSLDDIVGAAAAVLARDGYAALNMRSIAAELGVRPGALYWHVRSREELDALVFDHLLRDFAPPPVGDQPLLALKAFAAELRRHLCAHRDMTLLARGYTALGPNTLRGMEALLARLRAVGLEGRDAAYAYAAVMDYVVNFARIEASVSLQPEVEAEEKERQDVIAGLLGQLSADQYPNLLALAGELTCFDDVDARFAFGLDALIRGIAPGA